MTLAMATEHLELHHEANHGIHCASLDKLQKLEHPVLMTGCSQQDLKFFKEEWVRYATVSNVTEENLLRDQLLHCADLPVQKMLQNTIGSASLAKMTVMELMTQIEKTAVKRQSDLLSKI